MTNTHLLQEQTPDRPQEFQTSKEIGMSASNVHEVMVGLGMFEERVVYSSRKHPQVGYIHYEGKREKVCIGFWGDSPVWKLVDDEQEYTYCAQKTMRIDEDPEYCGTEPRENDGAPRSQAQEYMNEVMKTYAGSDTSLDKLTLAALGLAGESGEVADSIKKVLYQGHHLDIMHLIEELGDVLWYLSLACNAVECTLDDVMNVNVAKLRKRYPNSFDPEQSINRNKEEQAMPMQSDHYPPAITPQQEANNGNQ